ncbi:unnamed protein product [Lathyrus sativus]|nr:unnamed protein product [Lathyrus sativus]
MMDRSNLSEMDSIGGYYTWSNKHNENVIYFRIDHVLANMEWYKKYIHVSLNVLAPSVSDHAILLLNSHELDRQKRMNHFKFLNNVNDMDGYQKEVPNRWRAPLNGRPMYVLWKKQIRVHASIRALRKPLIGASHSMKNARIHLLDAQDRLMHDGDNPDLIKEVKDNTEEVFKWSEIEEKILKQRSKIIWLRLGDGNNIYFYAQVKDKRGHNDLTTIYKDDDTLLSNQEDI